MADEFARFDLTHVCPGCGQRLNRLETDGGRTVELVHPQPPCEAFLKFVARMLERHADERKRQRN